MLSRLSNGTSYPELAYLMVYVLLFRIFFVILHAKNQNGCGTMPRLSKGISL